MDLLDVEELILQTVHLHFQVRADLSQVIQDFPQAADVGVHRLKHIQLVFVPERHRRRQRFVGASEPRNGTWPLA